MGKVIFVDNFFPEGFGFFGTLLRTVWSFNFQGGRLELRGPGIALELGRERTGSSWADGGVERAEVVVAPWVPIGDRLRVKL